MDFIKKHPCIAVSIVGFLAILLNFFSEQFAAYGLGLILFFILALRFAGVILVGVNIAAMLSIANDKSAAGVILSLPLGGLGAMIGLLFNSSYEKETAVKVIFSVQLWVIIWAIFSFVLFNFDYYSTGQLPG